MDESGLRALCLPWPGVAADIKWRNELAFTVHHKMFATLHVQGAHRGQLAFKVPDDHFLALTEQPGILPAPYAARFKWISIARPADFDAEWLSRMIRQSYELVAAKLSRNVCRELGLA